MSRKTDKAWTEGYVECMNDIYTWLDDFISDTTTLDAYDMARNIKSFLMDKFKTDTLPKK